MKIMSTKKKMLVLAVTALAACLMVTALLTSSPTAPPTATQSTQTYERVITNDNPPVNTTFTVLDAPVSNYGHYWRQPGGYNYFSMSVTNSGNETIKVYIKEDNTIEDNEHVLLGSIAPNSTKTWLSPTLLLQENYHAFAIDYSSPTGNLEGHAVVRVSNLAFN